MGYSVELYEYKWLALRNAIRAKSTKFDQKLFNEILDAYGHKSQHLVTKENTFIILNNERDEEGNPWYGFADTLDSAFGIDCSFQILLDLKAHGTHDVDHEAVRERLDIP